MAVKKVDAIIQARLGSTRLPKKILLDISGKPLLEHVIDKLKKSELVDRIIIATTTAEIDDELAAYCEQRSILFFRGEVDNVLDRFIKAGEYFQCDKIIRVCSDNPFIDTQLMNEQLKVFTADDSIDYCTYEAADGQAIILKPLGLFVEAVTMKALKKIAAKADDQKYYEHVTMFIYQHPDLFNVKSMPLPGDINTNYRFTVDYPEDISFCEEIMRTIHVYSLKSLIELMEKSKSLREKNLSFSKAHEKKY